MSYRVEISATSRAGCQAKRCKDNAVKIQKGEMRSGVMVDIKEHQTWFWRHWGCVTPTVLHNWWDSAEQNLELIDGFEDLPEGAQQKVQTALEQGHVDDDEWNGDEGYNRYDPANPKQGMYARAPRKKKDDVDEKQAEEVSSPEKKPTKKRARGQDENGEIDGADDAKPAKKSKAKSKQDPVDEADDAEITAPKKKKTTKKAVKEEAANDEAPAPKKRQAKAKSKPKAPETDGDLDDDDDDEHAASDFDHVEEKPKTSRKKKTSANAPAVADAPKKTRGKKAKAEDVEKHVEEHVEEPKPKRKGRKATS